MIYHYRYHFLFALLAILSFVNLTIDIMDVDAAQYASISSEMSQTGNYLQVYHRGNDYLDKPPLLFWLSSLSISVFGNTSLAYKLPALLLLWLSLWAVYKFSRLWYDQRTGVYAALILGTTQGFYLMTNDVRTDGILTSFVILAAYFISVYLKTGKLVSLLIGGFCIGGAMLAKGPIGIIIPMVAIGVHLLIRREWKKIFNVHWLLLLIPVMLLLAPMLYGLYMQYDLHPEKEVYGLKGPSGVWFYFWTQSFGRITGDNYWQNDSSVFYFLQSLLWDLQPWVLLFIISFLFMLASVFKSKQAEGNQEWISLCGFIIPFIALSFSRYKLPHYIFPLFPFAAVMIAAQITTLTKRFRKLDVFHFAIAHVLVLMAILLITWVFPSDNFFIILMCVVLYGLFWFIRIKSQDAMDRIILPTVTLALLFQFVLSQHFYPHLLTYQASSQAGKLVRENNPSEIYWHWKHGHAFDYYSGRNIPELSPEQKNNLSAGTWIYTNEEGLKEFNNYKIIRQFDDYPVTLLSMAFLDPEKRHAVVKKIYLIEIR